jgi:hypothetical protein
LGEVAPLPGIYLMIIFTPGMTAFSYTTIGQPGEGAYREKGSKFLAFAFPVSSEDEIREKISQLKKQYFDARHH